MSAGGAVFMPALLLLLVTLLLAIGGIVLLRQGLRPRRHGTTPHCRKCDYNLTGLTGEKCPECGEPLTANSTVYGEGRRSTGRVIGGILCLVPLTVVLWFATPRITWYQLRPTGWLVTDLQSTNRTTANRAWNELDRRYRAGSLSGSQNAGLIDRCLKEQGLAASTPLMHDMVNHLGRAYLAGQMSAVQQDTFLKQAIITTLRTRPRTIVGQQTPLEIEEQARAPSSDFWVGLKEPDFSVDGVRLPNHGGRSGSLSGCGAGGSTGRSVTIDTPGRHKVGAVAHVEVWAGPYRDEKVGKLARRLDILMETELEVLPVEPPDYLKRRRGPDLDAAVRDSITPKELSLKPGDECRFAITLGIQAPPVGVALDVFIRTGGREYRVGSVHKAAGQSTNYGVSQTWRRSRNEGPAPFTSCDVILRGSDKVARGTVDLFEYWEGELVFKNVPVTLEGVATQPARPANE